MGWKWCLNNKIVCQCQINQFSTVRAFETRSGTNHTNNFPLYET